MIDIELYNVTAIATNCCLLIDSETGCLAVTDPGEKSDELINSIKEKGGKLEYVMLTHGHYDHIGYAKQLSEMFGAKIVTGVENNRFLSRSELNLSAKHNLKIDKFSADILLNDGDTFKLGSTEIKYITTPGHTCGCGCFIFDNTIIAGDTLFCESFGRTDLPSGNLEEMMSSIRKLKNLEGDYNVIPGHGLCTTLEHERKYNPLMSRL